MLQIENLSVAYGNNVVIKDISLHVNPGAVCGLAGMNGAGKSTLLNTLYEPGMARSGRLLWQGKPLHWQDIGYLVAAPYFYPRITGREYLDLFMLKNPGFRYKKWEALLDLPLGKQISTYSSGMQKKLAFIACLIQDKPIMLLDEPFNNLDMETVLIFREVIRHLKSRNKAIIVTSHIPETLAAISDFIVLLKEGCIAVQAGREEFQAVFTRMEEEVKEKAMQAGRLLG